MPPKRKTPSPAAEPAAPARRTSARIQKLQEEKAQKLKDETSSEEEEEEEEEEASEAEEAKPAQKKQKSNDTKQSATKAKLTAADKKATAATTTKTTAAAKKKAAAAKDDEKKDDDEKEEEPKGKSMSIPEAIDHYYKHVQKMRYKGYDIYSGNQRGMDRAMDKHFEVESIINLITYLAAVDQGFLPKGCRQPQSFSMCTKSDLLRGPRPLPQRRNGKVVITRGMMREAGLAPPPEDDDDYILYGEPPEDDAVPWTKKDKLADWVTKAGASGDDEESDE